jgi:hypothetical protein
MLPGMDDPSGELRRQRELIAAHLRWLDEQIARTPGPPPIHPVIPAASPIPAGPPTPPLGQTRTPPVSVVEQAPNPEIAIPEIDPGSVRNEVRRGCFIYVAIASLLLIVSVALAVWIARN